MLTDDQVAEAACLLKACNEAQARYFWGYLGGLLEGQVGRDKAATLLVEAKAALAMNGDLDG